MCVNGIKTSWQTFGKKVGENRDKLYFSQTICQHVVVSFTHTNLSLPTRVCQRMLLKRGMGNGEWGMGNGEWGMGNGEWGMGNGE